MMVFNYNSMTRNDWKVWNDVHNGKPMRNAFSDPSAEEIYEDIRDLIHAPGNDMTVKGLWNGAFGIVCIAILALAYVAFRNFGL